MSNLSFTITNIDVEPYAAVPQLTATLRVEDTAATVIHAIALRCAVQIEAQKRAYLAEEAFRLADQFGTRDRWATTLKPFQWMQCGLLMQGFTGSTEVELPLPVTYDFEVTSSRYLHALREQAVPLVFMFSGTVFTRGNTASGSSRCRGTARPAIRCPFRCGSPSWRRTTPAAVGSDSTATR